MTDILPEDIKRKLVEELSEDPEKILAGITTSAKRGEKEVPGISEFIIEALLGSKKSVIHVAKELAARGEKAAPEISYLVAGLINALDDDNYSIRGRAAEALMTCAVHKVITDTRAVDPLITALKDEEPYVRKSAAYTLRWLHDSRAVDPLIIRALEDELGIVREYAVAALGETMDARAVDPLVKILREDQNKGVRAEAALSLLRLKDTRAIEPLIDALGDEWEVQSSAKTALEKLTGQDFGSKLSKWPEWWEQNRGKYSESG